MSSPASSRTRPEGGRGIDRFFERLLGFYGNKFLDAYSSMPVDKVKSIWLEEMLAMRLTEEEIAAGVQGCRTLAWPPTLPEFLKLCRPPVDAAAAWYRAQFQAKARDRGEVGFDDPILYEAFRSMSVEIRGGDTHHKHIERWKALLEHAAEQSRIHGLPLPDAPPKALPEPPPTSKEEAQKHIAAIAERLKVAGIARIARVRVTDEMQPPPAVEGQP